MLTGVKLDSSTSADTSPGVSCHNQTPQYWASDCSSQAGSSTNQQAVPEAELLDKQPAESSEVTQVGKLPTFFNNWLKITKDPIILYWVKGYSIPFDTTPVQYSLPKNYSFFTKEKEILQIEINKLLRSGAVSACTPVKSQFLSRIFTVTKPNGSLKFILNIKELNNFIITDHFKMEDYHRTTTNLVILIWPI